MSFRCYPQLRIYHNRWARPEQGNETYQESQVNCGAAGGAAQLNFGAPQATLVTHHQFRLLAGNPGFKDSSGNWIATGLSTTSIAQALAAKGAKATRYAGESIWTAAKALQAGAAVAFAVQYSAINAFAGGIYSGDHNFTGGHYLACFGWRQDATGANFTEDWDSLLDGRRSAIKLAPVEIPFRMIRLAAGAFLVGGTPVGTDKGIFIVVEPPAGG